MTHFIEGFDRQQTMLLPEHLDDYVDEHSPVRAIDTFADMLDLAVLGFNAQPAATINKNVALTVLRRDDRECKKLSSALHSTKFTHSLSAECEFTPLRFRNCSESPG